MESSLSKRVSLERRVACTPKLLLRMWQFDGYTLMCRASVASDLLIAVDEQPHIPKPRQVTVTVTSVHLVGPDVATLRLKVDIARCAFRCGATRLRTLRSFARAYDGRFRT